MTNIMDVTTPGLPLWIKRLSIPGRALDVVTANPVLYILRQGVFAPKGGISRLERSGIPCILQSAVLLMPCRPRATFIGLVQPMLMDSLRSLLRNTAKIVSRLAPEPSFGVLLNTTVTMPTSCSLEIPERVSTTIASIMPPSARKVNSLFVASRIKTRI